MGAASEFYAGKIAEATKLLLGVRHSLLRREFRAETAPRSPCAGRPVRAKGDRTGSRPGGSRIFT